MKFIRKLIEMAMLLFIGFIAGIMVGSQINSPLDLIQNEEPSSVEDVEVIAPEPENDSESFAIPSFEIPSRGDADVHYEQIEKDIINHVNNLRADLGLNPVQHNEVLKAAATIRAVEIEESFAHTRPDGTDPFTVFDEESLNYNYRMVGENLAMVTYHRDDAHMAEFIFNGWVDSEGHYETMVNPEFEEIGVGVYYDGETLYATQFFGTQK